MVTKKKINQNVIIYQAKSGAIVLRGDFGKDTVWATQAQIAEMFQAERSVVTKHIRNILKDKEKRNLSAINEIVKKHSLQN